MQLPLYNHDKTKHWVLLNVMTDNVMLFYGKWNLVKVIKIFFWCAQFDNLYFRFSCVCNSLHPSSIWCRGLNPRPPDHESSA